MRRAILLFSLLGFTTANRTLPVVLWHGMGDSCCFSFSLEIIKKTIEETIPGIYVHSVRLGNNVFEDVERSYFGNVNEQISEVCEYLRRDERLKNGYNGIGFSQGAQLLRGVIERCGDVQAGVYVSIGGQQQGVFGAPSCTLVDHKYCEYIRRIFRYGAYTKYLQENFVQATYWHDPLHEEEYKKYSILLADINNERFVNQTYKKNLSKLKKMVLLKFERDRMVVPPESEWFGFYESGQDKKVLEMRDTDLYKEDRLGLKGLLGTGKIDFLRLPGDHLEFTKEWFVENIVEKYLR